ncbi:PIN/TRAM domain-containing protein [Exiguobacterium sp. SL-9]|uniref:PIN/TRAM domain-containing protein n=1 Tax=Exiguobacterium sp. SL-9 TaxID=2510963 RepID=UPI00103EDC12|nr:PIN/TRAM domain-containing protein [Exiguobacterium sp. SL-9]TCI20303.1 PIN/TRAM domain-containing protein [Exiguobacterium sp. SL-9]
MKIAVRIGFILIGLVVGWFGIIEAMLLLGDFGVSVPAWLTIPYVASLIGGLIFFILSLFLTDGVVKFIRFIEERLVRLPVGDILFGSIGLIIGLLIAFLISVSLEVTNIFLLSKVVPIFVTALFGYFGFAVGYRKRNEWIKLFVKSEREKPAAEPLRRSNDKILDTSVIIDGRIADISKTGFIEGTLIVPQFVIGELQYIADSSDTLKRNRGRRGLDILKELQDNDRIEVEIYDGDFEDVAEVDIKLIKLAELKKGIVVTNDYNLNKVCEVRNVPVLNINDLANSVKQIVIPGEEMVVTVIKEGKEQNQGVAYLEDGTMVVVEGGRKLISKTLPVVVTSVLQTSAGRMIFARPE